MDNQPGSAMPNTPPQFSPPAKKHRAKRIAIGVVIALIAFALLIAGTLLLGSKQIKAARKVSDEFVQDMDTNNASAAYALTTPAFQQTVSETGLTSLAKQVQQHVSGQPTESSWSITNRTGQPQSAVINYAGGTANSITVTLQKINGTWEVLNFKFNGL